MNKCDDWTANTRNPTICSEAMFPNLVKWSRRNSSDQFPSFIGIIHHKNNRSAGHNHGYIDWSSISFDKTEQSSVIMSTWSRLRTNTRDILAIACWLMNSLVMIKPCTEKRIFFFSFSYKGISHECELTIMDFNIQRWSSFSISYRSSLFGNKRGFGSISKCKQTYFLITILHE